MILISEYKDMIFSARCVVFYLQSFNGLNENPNFSGRVRMVKWCQQFLPAVQKTPNMAMSMLVRELSFVHLASYALSFTSRGACASSNIKFPPSTR